MNKKIRNCILIVGENGVGKGFVIQVLRKIIPQFYYVSMRAVIDDVADESDKADPDNSEENSDNSDEDAGEDDDSEEVSDEEAEKMLKQFTSEEIDKLTGKVD